MVPAEGDSMNNIVTNRVTGEQLTLNHQQHLSNKGSINMTHMEKIAEIEWIIASSFKLGYINLAKAQKEIQEHIQSILNN